MTDATIKAWESELKRLLERMKAQPSADHVVDRARMAVLEKLIADYYNNEG